MGKFPDLSKRPIAASGAMGRLGNGWTPFHRIYYGILPPIVPVLKTEKLEKRKGNPFYEAWWPLFWIRGCVNAMSLGCDGVSMSLLRDLKRLTRDSIPSFHADCPEEMQEIVRRVNKHYSEHPGDFVHVVAFEVNVSCPNADSPIDYLGILEAAKDLPRPVGAKIGTGQDQIRAVVTAARNGWILYVSAINAVLWVELFRNKISPLIKRTGLAGGVSGRPIRERALATIKTLRRLLPPGFLIIGGGGIQSYGDLKKFAEAGATGFSLGTVLTQYPIRAIVLLLMIRLFGLPTRT